MSDTPTNYSCISRTRWLESSRMNAQACSVWLSDSHLLVIEGTHFRERYSRIDYADIRYISIRETARFHWTLALSAVFVLFGLFLVVFAGTPGIVLGATTGLPALVVLVLNIWRGRTCTCMLHTAVQSRELPSVSRLRHAEQVVGQLGRGAADAQASLPSLEAALEHFGQTDPGEAPVTHETREGAPGTQAPSPPDLAPGPRHLLIHQLLGLGLGLHGVAWLALTALRAPAGYLVGIALSLGLALTTFATIAWQQLRSSTRLLKGATWAAGGYMMTVLAALWMLLLAASIGDALASPNQPQSPVDAAGSMLRFLAESTWSVWEIAFVVFMGGLGLILGAVLLVGYQVAGRRAVPPELRAAGPPPASHEEEAQGAD